MALRHVGRSAGKLAHDGEALGIAQCEEHVGQLAFGLPTLLAGMAVGTFGLTPTTLGYSALIVLFSAIAGLLRKFGTAD
jgi:hypothetical protein